jgi:hypothetical protein
VLECESLEITGMYVEDNFTKHAVTQELPYIDSHSFVYKYAWTLLEMCQMRWEREEYYWSGSSGLVARGDAVAIHVIGCRPDGA